MHVPSMPVPSYMSFKCQNVNRYHRHIHSKIGPKKKAKQTSKATCIQLQEHQIHLKAVEVSRAQLQKDCNVFHSCSSRALHC